MRKKPCPLFLRRAAVVPVGPAVRVVAPVDLVLAVLALKAALRAMRLDGHPEAEDLAALAVDPAVPAVPADLGLRQNPLPPNRSV